MVQMYLKQNSLATHIFFKKAQLNLKYTLNYIVCLMT